MINHKIVSSNTHEDRYDYVFEVDLSETIASLVRKGYRILSVEILDGDIN